MNFAMTHYIPRSCVKISDIVAFGIPRSPSSSCTVSHQSVDCSLKVFNILGCSACCRPSRTRITFSRFSTIFEALVPHFYLHCTHCTIPESLFSHPNTFCRGMLKLTGKFDANSLLYLFSYFECDSHTVHMLTPWCLPPPLTSTVRMSLFTHAHSSPLSLAARSHGSCANHSPYINDGWTFSGQTS